MGSNNKPAAAQEAVAWRDDAGNLYPDKESVDKYLPRGRTVHALYAAPVAAAPVDLLESTARRMFEQQADPLAAPWDRQWEPTKEHWRKIAALASTPAAPGIDLGQFRESVECLYSKRLSEYEDGQHSDADMQAYEVERRRLLSLIDASPKGVHAAPRFELTNGQIAQLADFAGMPMAGEPLEDQDVLVIQHSDAGHSGPGVYAHYDELPEEGAIYLDGQLPDSPKGGSDALARAYGYLWHVNHPEDIPAGHPFMSADRAAVEARKELRDMLTHEQRGEGINCVRQKLLADMQPTGHGAGVSNG